MKALLLSVPIIFSSISVFSQQNSNHQTIDPKTFNLDHPTDLRKYSDSQKSNFLIVKDSSIVEFQFLKDKKTIKLPITLFDYLDLKKVDSIAYTMRIINKDKRAIVIKCFVK